MMAYPQSRCVRYPPNQRWGEAASNHGGGGVRAGAVVEHTPKDSRGPLITKDNDLLKA